MKRCSCCLKLKNESEFHKFSHTSDGLQIYCKKCRNELRHGAKVIDIRPSIKNKSLTGGLKITVQNFAKSSEAKFNIYDTDTTELFQTSSKEKFLEKLSKLLEVI